MIIQLVVLVKFSIQFTTNTWTTMTNFITEIDSTAIVSGCIKYCRIIRFSWWKILLKSLNRDKTAYCQKYFGFVRISMWIRKWIFQIEKSVPRSNDKLNKKLIRRSLRYKYCRGNYWKPPLFLIYISKKKIRAMVISFFTGKINKLHLESNLDISLHKFRL